MTKTNEKIHVFADESLGGLKREYVKVDKVLQGCIYRVLKPTNIVHIDGPDGTERYEMVDRKAEVGEKVVVVDDEDSSEEFGNFRIGEVGTVESYATDDTYFGEYANVRVSDGRDIPIYLHEYRVLVPLESSEEEP